MTSGSFSAGLYIGRPRPGHGPIAPSPTSVTAFVGATSRGATHEATPVGSFSEYAGIFGAASGDCPVSMAVLQYFANGGRQAVIVRVSAPGSDKIASGIVGDAAKRKGVHACSDDPPTLLVTPDAAVMGAREHDAVVKSVLDFCEANRIFYLVDVPRSRSRKDPVDKAIDWAARSSALGHPNAAVYFPWGRAYDPSRKSGTIPVPPCGAVAGVYARTDRERGVWKSPAGTHATLLGLKAMEEDLNDAQIKRLLGSGINPLRAFPGGGYLVWGARTFLSATSDDEWKYVAVRRFYLFLERSIERDTQWSVFEPNGEPLWAQLRLSISSFLYGLFRRGAFVGPSARESYFVKCDSDTTTREDIHEGRVNVLVGFAPLKPAEFIVIRLILHALDPDEGK